MLKKLSDAEKAIRKKQSNQRWRANNKEHVEKYNKKYHRQWCQNNKQKCYLYHEKYLKEGCGEKTALITRVKNFYKCMNPECPYHHEMIDECCLDFHHVRKKKFSLTKYKSRSMKSIVSEIGKCLILCSNCHRKITYKKIDLSNIKLCNVKQMESA